MKGVLDPPSPLAVGLCRSLLPPLGLEFVFCKMGQQHLSSWGCYEDKYPEACEACSTGPGPSLVLPKQKDLLAASIGGTGTGPIVLSGHRGGRPG